MQYQSPTDLYSRIGNLLQQEIDRDNVVKLEALRFELAQKTTEIIQLSYEKDNQMLHPKDKDLTELDRRVMLNASTALIKRDLEFLKRLESIVEQRIQLFQYLTTEQKTNII